MSIFTRYLTREIIRHLFIILALVMVIYLAVDFFEKIDSFLETGTSATRAFWYFLYKIPLITVQMLPISLLLSVLVTFGIMSKRNELIALKSSGVSIYHLFKSVAAIGVVSAGVLFILSEAVAPAALARSNRIWREDVKGGNTLSTRENLWIKGDRSFFKIGQYDPTSRIMYDVTAYFLDDHFRLTLRMDAKRGTFRENQWVFEDLLAQEFDPASGVPEVSFQRERAVAIALQPEDLLQVAKKAEEMNCSTLRAMIKKIEAEGDEPVRYRVDLHYKIALPVVCLIMCLIGTSVAVRGTLKGGLPVIVSYGIGIAFLYYIVLSFCVSLGYGGILPPPVAAWAAHVLFLCVGGVTLITAE